MADLGSLNTIPISEIFDFNVSDAFESDKTDIKISEITNTKIVSIYESEYTHFKSPENREKFDIRNIELGGGDPLTSISVLVKREGIIIEGVKVVLFERDSNILVGSGYSDIDGVITFTGLNTLRQYYAVAMLDEDYNALVYDKLIPE